LSETDDPGLRELEKDVHDTVDRHPVRRAGRLGSDWGAEFVGMAAQVMIGCLVSAFLTRMGTVAGVSGAVLAGVSAPAILAQLGQMKWPCHLLTDNETRFEPGVLRAVPDGDGPEPEGAVQRG
jgi:hypothetical protein